MTDAAATPAAEAGPARGAPSLSARLTGGAFAVFERDFLVATSRRRYVVLRSVIVALAAIAALWILCVAESASDRWLEKNLGTVLFAGPAIGTVVLTALLGPAMSSDSIAGERVLETLPITLAAPMRPLGFVLAKFASRVIVLLVPMLAVVPIASLGLVHGGVRQGLLGDYVAFLVLTACLTVAAGVFASAWSGSVARATILAYLLALLLPAIEFMLGVWLVAGPRGGTPFETWFAHNPFVAGVLTGMGRGAGVLTGSPLGDFAVAVGVCTAAALSLATWRIAREFHVAATKSRRLRAPRPIRFDDGVLHRASPRWFFVPSSVGEGVTLLLVWTAAILPAVASDWDDDGVMAGMHVAAWLTFLLTLVRASQAFAGERQSGALGLLLVTPAGKATELVSAHARAAGVHALRLVLPAFSVGLLYALDTPDEKSVGTLLAWCAGTPVLILLAVAIGLWRSACAASSGGAIRSVAFALFVPMAAWGLLWGAVFMLVEAVGRVDEEAAGLAFFPLPPVGYSFLTLLPADRTWNGEEAFLFGCGVAWLVLTAGFSAFLLARTVGILDRRDSE